MFAAHDSYGTGTIGHSASARFIVQIPDADLLNEQALSELSTGLLKSTAGTGVVSIAQPNVDYVSPTGVAGGQTIIGGTGAGDGLTIRSTSNATLGSITLNASQVLIPNGTDALPAIAFTGDTDTGISTYASNALAINAGGVRSFVIGATGNTAYVSTAGPSFVSYLANTLANVTAGLIAKTNTDATLENPIQNSLGVMWSARVWDTDNTVSRTMDWIAYNSPTSGASPYSSLVFATRTDNGAWATPFSFVGALYSTSPQLRVGNGTATGPVLRPAGADGAGIFFPSATGVSVSTGSTERLAISATGGFTFIPALSAAGSQNGLLLNGTITSSDLSANGVWINTTLTPGPGGSARGILVSNTASVANGVTINYYGVDVAAVVKSGTGTIQNIFGLYIADQTAGVTNYGLYSTAKANRFSQTAAAGGSPLPHLDFTAGAHTNLNASTEVIDYKYDMSAVKTWAAGAITTQRDFVIKPRTYAFASASTVTNGATFVIEGAPIAGNNATITSRRSFWVQSGDSVFDGAIWVQTNALNVNIPNIGTAQTQGLNLTNNTAAVSPGATVQYTPSLYFRGNAWETTGGTSQPVDWLIQGQTTSGATASGNLVISQRINSGAWAQKLTIDSMGILWAQGLIAGSDGSSTYPTMRRQGAVGLGMYFPSSTDVAFATNSVERLRITSSGNAVLVGGYVQLNNITTPQVAPTGGGYMFAEDGAGKWIGSSGTVTTFGPAAPHCPRCGRDFAHEWANAAKGEKLSICVPCMIAALEKAGVPASAYSIVKELS